MRRLFVPLALGVMLSAGVRLRAADDLVLSRFGDYMEALRSQAGIPGLAATIVGPTDIVWERFFGYQNLERSIGTSPLTSFHLDSITQIATATLVLRCVQEGRLSLDDRIGAYDSTASEPNATLRELLSHTSRTSDAALVFSYRPERLGPLPTAISACTKQSFRQSVASLLDSLAMFDSVPGADAVSTAKDGDFPTTWLERYTSALERLAIPYSVDEKGRASASHFRVTTLGAATGLISTSRDLAQFDLALKRGVLLHDDTIITAWTPPIGRNGQRLRHGLGWFVQSYSGEPVVWQFGVGEDASSSLVIMVPRRGLTLILLANSDGLAKPPALALGDVTVSPFARVFLSVFAR
jgi:CubicO group peptidase (beta-lactamase class C family)